MKTKLDYLIAAVVLCAIVSIVFAVRSHQTWVATAADETTESAVIAVSPIDKNVYDAENSVTNDCEVNYEEHYTGQGLFICFFNLETRSVMGLQTTPITILQEERNHITFNIKNDDLDHAWTLDFKAPQIAPLQVQFYDNADAYVPSTKTETPQMGLFYQDQRCGGGRFIIYEVRYDKNGQLVRLSLDFEQDCSNKSDLPPLYGYIRYNASSLSTP